MRRSSSSKQSGARWAFLLALAVTGAAVVVWSSTAFGSESRSALLTLPCSIADSTNLSATDLECFWNTEMRTTGPSVPSQTPSPLGGGGASFTVTKAKAAIDECFAGIGNAYPRLSNSTCPAGSIPKTNQTYTWATVFANNSIWIGTAPNMSCLGSGGSSSGPRLTLDGGSAPAYGGTPGTYPTPPYSFPTLGVCEFAASVSGRRQIAPLGTAGDWRMPRIYQYNPSTDSITDKSTAFGTLVALQQTLGVRSAGTLNGVVFLAGPALSRTGGIRIFAFNASTGRFIGSKAYPQYYDIRKWAVVNGQLYTAVGTTGPAVNGIPTVPEGRILRWTGSASNPLAFQEVGAVDNDAAEIYEFNDGGTEHLFVGTWPDPNRTDPAGLWESPPVPTNGGLTGCTVTTTVCSSFPSGGFTEVWKSTDYDPDPITAAIYGTGSMASFGGWLYWGTMLAPEGAGHRNTRNATGASTIRKYGAQRPISIWRGQGFGTVNQKIELLYGDKQLPVDCGPTTEPTCGPGDQPETAGTPSTYNRWALKDNLWNGGGSAPLCGPGGFGNYWNNYTDEMAVLNGHLYVGTMDWRTLNDRGQSGSVTDNMDFNSYGPDLWRFDSAGAAGSPGCAVAESVNGLGNPSTLGIRTLIAANNVLWAGMSTDKNLLNPAPATNNDQGNPLWGGQQGGWQMRKIVP